MQDSSNNKGLAQYPPSIKDETLEEMRRTRYPTTTRANFRRSSSSSPEDPSGPPQPQTDNINSVDYRDNQDPFCDMLNNEPVLSGGNMDIRKESDGDSHADHDTQDTSDNISTTATFAGYGREDREEGTGDHSSNSSGSPTRDTARYGGSPRRGLTRPRSYILRGEAYVALTDIRDEWATSANHICRKCRDRSKCWCPNRESPNTNGRGPRRQRLDRCGSCGKLYVIHGTSCQWCCHDWVSGPSRSLPPDR